MRPVLAVALLVILCRPAAAEPEPTTVIAADVMAGAAQLEGGEGGAHGALGLELAHHLGGSLWAHGMLAAGGVRSFDRYSGTSLAARAGLEARLCAGPRLCVRGGVDAAVLHLTESETNNPGYQLSHTAPGAVVRAGIDVGGRAVRLLVAVEAGRALTQADYVADVVVGVAVPL